MKIKLRHIMSVILLTAVLTGIYAGTKHKTATLTGISEAVYYHDSYYMIDNDGITYNFFRTDEDGQITGQVDVPKLSGSWWNSYSNLCVDKDGEVYVYSYQLSMESNQARSLVYRCDFIRKRLELCWELPGVKVIRIQVRDGILYTVLPEDDIEKTGFYSINREGEKRLLYLADMDYSQMVNAYYSQEGHFFFTDYHGLFYRDGKLLDGKRQGKNQHTNVWMGDTGLYYTDMSDWSVRNIVPGTDHSRHMISCDQIKPRDRTLDDRDVMPLQYLEDGGFLAGVDVDGEHRGIGRFDKEGKEQLVWEELSYSRSRLWEKGINTGIALTLVLTIILCLLALCLKLTDGMIPIVAKLSALLIPVIIIGSVILSKEINTSLTARMKEIEYNLLYAIADGQISRINPKYYAAMDLTKIPKDASYEVVFPSQDYSDLPRVLYDQKGDNTRDIIVRTYQWIYLMDQGYLRYAVMDDSYYGARLDDVRDRTQMTLMKQAMEEGIIVKTQYNDREGNWIALYVPLIDQSGKSIGIMESGLSSGVIQYEAGRQMAEIEARIGAIMAVIILIMLGVLTYSLSPIRALKYAVGRMAEGILGEEVKVRGLDEVARISAAFNGMSLKMKEQVDFISCCSKAYAKFVPEKIFEILERDNVTMVTSGDYKEISAGMLTINEPDFKNTSKNINTAALYSMINRTMEALIPLVSEGHGIVERMSEAGLTAIFPQNSKNALNCAINISQLMIIRKEQGEYLPHLWAAISYGEVRLGIVGQEERVAASVISELTALNTFLMDMGVKYGAKIVITASAAARIDNFKTHYHSRLLGYIYMEQAGVLEAVYDVYDGDSQEVSRLKTETFELFSLAVADYLAENYYEARRRFAKILRINSQDKAAKEYIYRCDTYYQTKVRTGTESYLDIY